MADVLDRRSIKRLWWRTIALLAIPALLVPVGCHAAFLLTHPAPLGRSAKAILEHLDAALPNGSTVDSARTFFRTRGVSFEVNSAARYTRDYGDDSAVSGGPVLIASEREIAREWWIVYSGDIRLFFDNRGRLVARRAELSADNAL